MRAVCGNPSGCVKILNAHIRTVAFANLPKLAVVEYSNKRGRGINGGCPSDFKNRNFNT